MIKTASAIGLLFHLLLTGLAGCSADKPEPPARVPGYSIAIYNGARVELRGVAMTWGPESESHGIDAGILPAGAMRTRLRMPDPIPDRVTVKWQMPSGTELSEEVSIADKTPIVAAQGGTTFVKIMGASVSVESITTAEIRRRVQIGEPYP